MATMSGRHCLLFDGVRQAQRLSVPSLFVHGDGCVFPGHVRHTYDTADGPRRLVWMEGLQVDFYDRTDLVDAAVAESGEHFAASRQR